MKKPPLRLQQKRSSENHKQEILVSDRSKRIEKAVINDTSLDHFQVTSWNNKDEPSYLPDDIVGLSLSPSQVQSPNQMDIFENNFDMP